MAVKFLDNTGLGYFWGKIKAWCNSTFAAIAHTHTSYAVKHSYTTAANAAKNWYRIANANTSQTDTTKPIHAQFILTAYNTSYDAGYYERWFINAEVFGRNAHIVILGNATAPFSQARILYENTIANLDANDRPAIDIYLNYQLANGTTKIEIEEVYNQGWTFLANGQLAASTVPSGFESVASTIRNNGIDRSTTADYASYLNRQISNITAAFTLADSYLYRSRTLNCTGTFTITIPSINSGYMWCVIKNKNTSSGVITLHPSTTSVLIDGSNADIKLQPMEYVCIHSAGANNYSLIADGRWKSKKADKATTLAGYGITDAKIANGTITLGSNSITPLTSVPSHNQASNTVNLLTGYSKPNTGSALATTDTLNQALGKLEVKVDTAIANSTGIPVGSVVWLSTSTVPAGFLLCNGQAVGRATYPDLFTAIGTTYGSGDDSTTFNLPNLIGKFIEGTDNNVGTNVTAGLPNIIGSYDYIMSPGDTSTISNGAITRSYISTQNLWGSAAGYAFKLTLNASHSNSIYGNSDTVQPPALKLLPCIKAYSSVDNLSSLDAAQLENELQNNYVHKSLLGINNSAFVPIGAVIYYAKSTVPSGFLICNGGAVSRTTYATLFNVIGTTFGGGNGSSTFNVPNLIGRFPEGSATPGTVLNAGLPNITGQLKDTPAYIGSGCYIRSGTSTWRAVPDQEPGGSKFGDTYFSAQNSNSIYGNSTTVQPPALTLVPCIRYA